MITFIYHEYVHKLYIEVSIDKSDVFMIMSIYEMKIHTYICLPAYK